MIFSHEYIGNLSFARPNVVAVLKCDGHPNHGDQISSHLGHIAPDLSDTRSVVSSSIVVAHGFGCLATSHAITLRESWLAGA
jgi:hypothetical protein